MRPHSLDCFLFLGVFPGVCSGPARLLLDLLQGICVLCCICTSSFVDFLDSLFRVLLNGVRPPARRGAPACSQQEGVHPHAVKTRGLWGPVPALVTSLKCPPCHRLLGCFLHDERFCQRILYIYWVKRIIILFHAVNLVNYIVEFSWDKSSEIRTCVFTSLALVCCDF